jgi:hypothetical protein
LNSNIDAGSGIATKPVVDISIFCEELWGLLPRMVETPAQESSLPEISRDLTQPKPKHRSPYPYAGEPHHALITDEELQVAKPKAHPISLLDLLRNLRTCDPNL